ncbi:MAG TPA: hypothetical protein VD788_01225 [Candidatus Polarisedimenticolaceae bacterium]|nr:hypothetical protein [Candidatus Polarisedimenticolaceae bacterium]
MTAGVVAYKICDRGFDCEHCPLDIGLRGADWPLVPRRGRIRPETTAFRFPDDRLYLPAHTWARPVDEDRVRCGIDAFGAGLLRHASALVLPAAGATVEQGRVGFWLSAHGRPVPFLSPVSGRVERRNRLAQKRPILVARASYDEGWLLEVHCRDWSEQRSRLVDSARIKQRTRRDMQLLGDQLSRSLAPPGSSLGRTMADGGQPLFDFLDAIDPERFRKLIMPLLV